VRMLVSAPGGLGHLGPVLALAGAARDGGHDVRVVVSARDADHVRRRELDVGVIPPPSAELERALGGASAQAEGLMAQGRRAEGDRHYVREVFGRLQCEVGLPVLRDEIAAFAPDLVLTDPFQSAAVTAAIFAGVPFALTPFCVWEPLSDLLEELVIGQAAVSEPMGLSAPDLLLRLRRAPRFSPLPAMFESPGEVAPSDTDTDGTVRWRLAEPGRAAELDADLARTLAADDRPLVYATLGTVAGTIPPMRERFLGALLPAMAERDVRCVLTVGQRTDLAALPDPPDNVTIAPFLPQRALLALAAVAVSHGGLNTTLDIAAARVPNVVVPLHAADGHWNAARVQQLGAGRSLAGPELTAAGLAAAIDGLLDDADAAVAAMRLGDAVAALPPPAEVVDRLEAAARAPQLR